MANIFDCRFPGSCATLEDEREVAVIVTLEELAVVAVVAALTSAVVDEEAVAVATTLAE